MASRFSLLRVSVLILGASLVAIFAFGCAPQTTQMEACNGNECHKVDPPAREPQPPSGPTPSEKLRKQAAFDMQCTKEDLQFTAIGEEHWYASVNSWGVRGCGKQASYIVTPTGCSNANGDVCNWVLNSPIQKTQ
jgi:hypothetical protein